MSPRIIPLRKKILNNIEQYNETVAAYCTLKFGNMWTFYFFFIYGLLPLLPFFMPYRDAFFYWSGWIQLWALPLLMVGGIVLNKSNEIRDNRDHQTLLKEFTELKEISSDLKKLISEVNELKDKR